MSYLKSILAIFKALNSEILKASGRMREIERRIDFKIRRLKREIVNTFYFLLFLFFTMIFLSIGLIVFLNRFFPLDIIFLVLGGVFAFVALIFNIMS